MKKYLIALAFACLSFGGANATTCNDPSGFLKAVGPIDIGNNIIMGPDCQSVQDGGTGGFPAQVANSFFAGPTTGPAAFPSFRAMVSADLPLWSQSPLTGFVNRTIFSKLSDTVNPIDFGADKTGGSDSLNAFNNAVIGAKNVTIGPGSYTLSGTWNIPTGVSILFVGNPTISFTNAGAACGLNLQGSYISTVGAAVINGPVPTATYSSGNNAICAIAANVASRFSNINLGPGLRVVNWGDSGFISRFSLNYNISGVEFTRLGRAGILMLSDIGSKITFNSINAITPGNGGTAPYLNAYGITMTRDVGSDDGTNFPISQDGEIIGNYVNGVYTWEGIDTHGGLNIKIAKNTVRNTLVPIAVVPGDGPTVFFNAAYNTLEGNYIECANPLGPNAGDQATGILMSPASAGGAVTPGMKIVNNTLIGCGTNIPATFPSGAGIYNSQTQGAQITGNKLYSSRWSAIDLDNNTLSAVVALNEIIGVSSVAANQTGVRAKTATVEGIVSNNSFSGAFNGIQIVTAPSSAAYGLFVPDTNDYQTTTPFAATYASNTFSNANYTIIAWQRSVAQIGVMSAARVVTLPLANSVAPGVVLRIYDASGTVTATNTISVARAGADTIQGGAGNVVVAAAAYGYVELTSDGISKWTIGGMRPATTTQIGGTLALAPVANQFLTGIAPNTGIVTAAQPTCANLSGVAASCSTDATNASNISSGTLAAARGGAGTINGALKANGSGVVSLAACADLSDDGVYCSATQGQLPGVTGATVATAGNIGELSSSTVTAGAPVSLTTVTPVNLTSLSLTAGEWDVNCIANFQGQTTTLPVYHEVSISNTTNTLSATVGEKALTFISTGSAIYNAGPAYASALIGPARRSLSGTTTVYCVVQSSFSGGTETAFGLMRATRVH